MSTHIAKFEHKNGAKLALPEMWCGASWSGFDVYFTSLQHYALSNERGDSWGYPVCKKCLKAGMEAMEQE